MIKEMTVWLYTNKIPQLVDFMSDSLFLLAMVVCMAWLVKNWDMKEWLK